MVLPMFAGFVPRARTLMPSSPDAAPLPWWRIWVQLPEYCGIHIPIGAEVQGGWPVLRRAAGIAHPTAGAAVRVPIGCCREQTFSLGLSQHQGGSSCVYLMPQILFSPTHHPVPYQTHRPISSATVSECEHQSHGGYGSQRGSKAGPDLGGLPQQWAACLRDSLVMDSVS